MISGNILKVEKGGYERTDVLNKLDAYNSLLMLLGERRMSSAEIYSELDKIRSMPLGRVKVGRIFGGSGFSVKDTDEYIEELERQIQSKIF